MESIFEKVDRMLNAYDVDGEELDDLIVELENAKPTLDERLDAIGYTRDEALAAARSETAKHADLAKRIGVSNLNLPYAWIELVELCDEKNEPSKDKLELVLWLMASGRLTETTGLTDDEMISDWLRKNEKVKQYTEYLTEFNRTLDDFVKITMALEKAKPKDQDDKRRPAESDRVFGMLKEDEFIDNGENKEILHGNLERLSGFIAELPLLEPIKPLVYFQVFVRYNKKLFNNTEFTINPKKIFEGREYNIANNNGKNYKQNMVYCALYSELKNCFPDADRALCDVGFMACSNLAEWWYKIGLEGYSRNENIKIPITPQVFVWEQCVSCFEKSTLGKTMNISSGQLIEWRESNPTICTDAEDAASRIKFDDLRAFADDSVQFCGKLISENTIGSKKPADHDIAWALVIGAVEDRFDELLEDQITDIICRYCAAL